MLRLFTGIDLCLRGLGQAPDAPKEVELPGCTKRALVERKIGICTRWQRWLADGARPYPAGIGTVADLREELRARGGQRADELIDPCRRDLYIQVFTQRGFHQFVQNRVTELLPPFGVGDIGRLGVIHAPGVGGHHRGALVVRSDCAAGETDGQ